MLGFWTIWRCAGLLCINRSVVLDTALSWVCNDDPGPSPISFPRVARSYLLRAVLRCGERAQ